MCGISGELRFDDQAPDHAAIARMKDALARRGPDSEGDYCDGPLAFGHRRFGSNSPLIPHIGDIYLL